MTAQLDLSPLRSALSKLRRALPEDAERILRLSAEGMQSEAQVDAPIRTGFLKETHGVARVDDKRAELRISAQYALAVHETHPTKSRWALNAWLREGPRIIEKAAELVLGERARRASK